MLTKALLLLFGVLVLWVVAMAVSSLYWNINTGVLVGIIYLPAVAILSTIYTKLR